MAAKGLTPDQLARELDVNVRLVQKWRAGSVIPSYSNLRRLSDALGQPVAWFFSDEVTAA